MKFKVYFNCEIKFPEGTSKMEAEWVIRNSLQLRLTGPDYNHLRHHGITIEKFTHDVCPTIRIPKNQKHE